MLFIIFHILLFVSILSTCFFFIPTPISLLPFLITKPILFSLFFQSSAPILFFSLRLFSLCFLSRLLPSSSFHPSTLFLITYLSLTFLRINLPFLFNSIWPNISLSLFYITSCPSFTFLLNLLTFLISFYMAAYFFIRHPHSFIFTSYSPLSFRAWPSVTSCSSGELGEG